MVQIGVETFTLVSGTPDMQVGREQRRVTPGGCSPRRAVLATHAAAEGSPWLNWSAVNTKHFPMFDDLRPPFGL